MPGKKKSPTPSTAKKTGAEPHTEAPKRGSTSSLLPSVESEGCQGCQGSQEFHAGNLAPFDFEGRSVALVSPSALRAFLADRGGVLAPGGPSLEATPADLLLVPSSALYVADGEARPLAEDLLEIPALLRLADASRAASEAA